jgi:predicted aspartyl protease
MVRLKVQIANSQEPDRKTPEIEAIVDTGSWYTWFPRKELEDIGLRKFGKRSFRTITGQVVERDFGIGAIIVDGSSGGSEVVFGEDTDGVVLGVLAMEGMGLKVDPRNGKIIREDIFLAY